MNRLIALGVVVVAVIYLAFSSLYVVNVREQAIVMRFGQITDVKSEPGLYFKLPTSMVDTVLIVEDNPDVIRVIHLSLRREFKVMAAPDGLKGFELAVKEQPNLIHRYPTDSTC